MCADFSCEDVPRGNLSSMAPGQPSCNNWSGFVVPIYLIMSGNTQRPVTHTGKIIPELNNTHILVGSRCINSSTPNDAYIRQVIIDSGSDLSAVPSLATGESNDNIPSRRPQWTHTDNTFHIVHAVIGQTELSTENLHIMWTGIMKQLLCFIRCALFSVCVYLFGNMYSLYVHNANGQTGDCGIVV